MDLSSLSPAYAVMMPRCYVLRSAARRRWMEIKDCPGAICVCTWDQGEHRAFTSIHLTITVYVFENSDAVSQTLEVAVSYVQTNYGI